jgi:hypothetical protein
MLKEKKATIGGILIILSIFFPATLFVFELDHGRMEENRWFYGQKFRVLFLKGGGRKSNLYLGVSIHSVVGIICAIVLLILAIKIILIAYDDDKGKQMMKFGITSILVLIFNTILEISQAVLYRPSFSLFLPHVGFVGILLGGSLATLSGYISGYKSR